MTRAKTKTKTIGGRRAAASDCFWPLLTAVAVMAASLLIGGWPPRSALALAGLALTAGVSVAVSRVMGIGKAR